MALNPLNPEFYRKIFFIAFIVLIFTIIMTPLLVTRGFSFLGEEMLESFLLFIQVTVAWRVFRLYESSIKRREKSMEQLEKEYQKREKELLETFAYLGKVNVQISLIKDFLAKLKAPTSKKEVKKYMDDILHMALTISKKDWITVRVINTNNMQTISEYWAKNLENGSDKLGKIGNREIIKISENINLCNSEGYCVLSSAGSKPEEEKAFLVFREKGRTDIEIIEFLKAAVNQCEIVHTLFVLGYGGK